jgi:uncharacterized membrane protein YgcG
MHPAIPAPGTISWVRRLFKMRAALFTLLLLALTFALAQPASAQLALSNNYFVTGDYVVGGVGLRGLGVNGVATGTINVPDKNSVPATGVPAGADIVAAYLYWETVEKSQSASAGQQGSFNGYAITGTQLGNPNAPTSWSSGGCSGSSNGTATMRMYRADVRPYLPLDANGNIKTPNSVTPGSYQVRLADSGSNGGGTPLTLGASLVIIYRVQSPQVPLNSIVLYDGALAPSNSSSTMSLTMQGFYDAATAANAKITHIVGNGQPNKSETVYLNGATLSSLYGSLPPFPGIYNQNTISATGGGSWDNPTWTPTSAVPADAPSAMTQVVPSGSNSGCVNWGVVIFSTTVQNSDSDGLLDAWKRDGGYTDVNTGQWVALPGAKKGQKDLFIELDYSNNLDSSAGSYPHSHLPKQAALDKVGDALLRAGVHVHFDLGAGIYQSDIKYVISYPVPPPKDSLATVFPSAGGNAISEGLLVCKDGITAPLCAFPNQATVGWKGGVEFVQSDPTLGNFEPGRKDSYHYVFFAHGLGMPRTYWASAGLADALKNSGVATLNSISVSNNVATVIITTPAGFPKPGDPGCSDANCDRVTVDGALLPQPKDVSLNGIFQVSALAAGPGANQTTFTIQTPGVINGVYDFSSEPELVLSFGGPVSMSGFSDVGGADSTVTFGLWPADDAADCQPDPTKATTTTYCTNQVGTITAEAGTLLHELGHTLFLTHGGTFFPKGNVVSSEPLAGQQTNSALEPANYGLNCNPAFLSTMNYLFQIRGFPDGGIDYSNQTLPSVSELALNEQTGLGTDMYNAGQPAHLTRWFARPSPIDTQLGTRTSQAHCDGTPTAKEEKLLVRVDENPIFKPMIDWNNDLVIPNQTQPVAWQDVNFNGSIFAAPDPPASPAFNDMQGFNDWVNLDLRQIGARSNAFGSSGNRFTGGGSRFTGGGNRFTGGGNRFTGGGSRFTGGGSEQDSDLANTTADSPLILTPVMSGHSVLVTWNVPDFGQFRVYSVWRATGSFASLSAAVAAKAAFTNIGSIGKLTNTAPPSPLQVLDGTVKNNTYYTYFVAGTNKQGVQSAPSATRSIFVKF